MQYGVLDCSDDLNLRVKFIRNSETHVWTYHEQCVATMVFQTVSQLVRSINLNIITIDSDLSHHSLAARGGRRAAFAIGGDQRGRGRARKVHSRVDASAERGDRRLQSGAHSRIHIYLVFA